jgi:WD40 repeat protein
LWDIHDVESQPLLVGHGICTEVDFDTVVVAFSSTESQFIFNKNDSATRLYDIQSKEYRDAIDLGEGTFSLTFSPNDHQIAIGTSKGMIYLWDKQSEEPCTKLEGHEREVNCIAYSPCGQWIASGSGDQTVAIWHRRLSGEVESWSRAHSIHGFFNAVLRVAWNPVVPMEFATGTKNGTVQVWRMSIDGGGDITIKMVWSSRLDGFYTEGAIFANAKGLNPINQKLLVQRSAFI